MTAFRERNFGFAILQQVLFHAIVSALAIGIAFSLPAIAGFVLYEWWPRVSGSSKLLLVTELAFAATLVLLFNALHLAWEGMRARHMRNAASLVQVRRDGASAPAAGARGAVSSRDALILAVTGFHTFVSDEAPFRSLVGGSLETRVLLLNPLSEGARERIRSLPDPEAAEELYRRETAASIEHLRKLHDAGRHVRLKLYDRAPLWNIVVAGDRAWVRHCHDGQPLRTQPDYVFELRQDQPTQGLFPPFCRFALEQWNDPANAEYDFATGELVRRSREGAEEGRAALPVLLPG